MSTIDLLSSEEVELTAARAEAPAAAQRAPRERVPMSSSSSRNRWPKKLDLFGVGISRTNYADAVERLIAAAKDRQSATVTALAVHGTVTAAQDEEYRNRIAQFDVVCPDGQPVRWALNHFHDANLTDRVYGPELMLRLCQRAAEDGVGVFLYASKTGVLEQLKANLLAKCPGLSIVGAEEISQYPLPQDELEGVLNRINESGAGLVFLGLGCPRQEIFAAQNKHRIKGVTLCVGAAFDFHAGVKKMAPPWMQKRGLEWLFRLYSEPRRLWRRYLVTNTTFVLLCLGRKLKIHS
jgi:exopolysaccharide biosynthesis WecB/TagA/CpsF family protein